MPNEPTFYDTFFSAKRWQFNWNATSVGGAEMEFCNAVIETPPIWQMKKWGNQE